MYKRFIRKNIEVALADTPVVFVMGPRQSGKTTLVKSIIDSDWNYITFDDDAQLLIAKRDPVGFIRNLPNKHTVLDEIQRSPELFTAIKQSVDERREPGRFLLTGSANALVLPRLSDSLAGRMEIIRLSTLSENEIQGTEPTFLQNLLEQKPLVAKQVRIYDYLVERLVKGCYPEPLQRTDSLRSAAWYQNYVDTLIQRDINDLTHINRPADMEHLLKLTAFYSGCLINFSQLGAKLSLSHVTIKKYVALLEHLFLVKQLSAWHSNEYRRLIKSPKIHMADTGLLCAIRNINKSKLLNDPSKIGPILESFVFNELCKQASCLQERLSFYHYRDKDGVEVDIVIENSAGECFGIEIKKSATLRDKDMLGLTRMKEVMGERFKLGVLLYDGDHTTAFGDNLFAVPLGALWA